MFVSSGYHVGKDAASIDFKVVETRRLLLKHFNTAEMALKIIAIYGFDIKHAHHGETVRVSYEKLGVTSEVYGDYEKPVESYMVDAVLNLLETAIIDGHINTEELMLFTGITQPSEE